MLWEIQGLCVCVCVALKHVTRCNTTPTIKKRPSIFCFFQNIQVLSSVATWRLLNRRWKDTVHSGCPLLFKPPLGNPHLTNNSCSLTVDMRMVGCSYLYEKIKHCCRHLFPKPESFSSAFQCLVFLPAEISSQPVYLVNSYNPHFLFNCLSNKLQWRHDLTCKVLTNQLVTFPNYILSYNPRRVLKSFSSLQ